MVKETLLQDVLETYKPIYPEGEDWDVTLNYLMTEEREHMESLMDSVERNGMREPIMLSDLEDDYYAHPVVLNGTHRVVLAMLTGMFTVPTLVDQASLSDDVSDAETEMLTVEIAGNLTEEEGDDLFDMMRSFELNNNQWAESFFSSSTVGKSSVFYMDSMDLNHEELARKVRKMVAERFTGRNLTVTVQTELG